MPLEGRSPHSALAEPLTRSRPWAALLRVAALSPDTKMEFPTLGGEVWVSDYRAGPFALPNHAIFDLWH